MMRARKLLQNAGILTLLLLGQTSVGSAGPKKEPLSLASELAGYVTELVRPIHVFHYADRRYKRIEGDGMEYFARQAGSFWDPSKDERSGMVLATDPTYARRFGGSDKDWALFRVELPKGAPVLSLDVIGSETLIPRQVLAKLASANCRPKVATWNHLLRESKERSCREIVFATLRDLNVMTMAVPYGAADFKDCTSRPSYAHVMLQPGRLAPGSVRLLTAESVRGKPGSALDTEIRMIKEAFRQRSFPVYADRLIQSEFEQYRKGFWPELDSRPATEEEFRAYLSKHIDGCESMLWVPPAEGLWNAWQNDRPMHLPKLPETKTGTGGPDRRPAVLPAAAGPASKP